MPQTCSPAQHAGQVKVPTPPPPPQANQHSHTHLRQTNTLPLDTSIPTISPPTGGSVRTVTRSSAHVRPAATLLHPTPTPTSPSFHVHSSREEKHETPLVDLGLVRGAATASAVRQDAQHLHASRLSPRQVPMPPSRNIQLPQLNHIQQQPEQPEQQLRSQLQQEQHRVLQHDKQRVATPRRSEAQSPKATLGMPRAGVGRVDLDPPLAWDSGNGVGSRSRERSAKASHMDRQKTQLCMPQQVSNPGP